MRRWEGIKLEAQSSKLKGSKIEDGKRWEDGPAAVGGALRLRLEAKKVKGEQIEDVEKNEGLRQKKLKAEGSKQKG